MENTLKNLRNKVRKYNYSIRKDKDSGGYVVIDASGDTQYLVNCLVYGPDNLEGISAWLDRMREKGAK